MKCLDPKHAGNRELRSSVTTLRVASKDSGKYGVKIESLVCGECQARAKVEEQQAKLRKQKEEAFVAALRKHDDEVLLCCRGIAAASEATPGRIEPSVWRDIRRLRSLARSGKQLCAPESLGHV